MNTLFLTALAILFAGWVFSRWFEWSHAFKPVKSYTNSPADEGLTYEEVYFVAEDGCRLHGWWYPHERPRGTILYCHGNAGNIAERIQIASDLTRLGVNVFMFDYRGYGKSRGVASEKGLYRDGRAAFEVVRARYRDVEQPPVIVYGASLGGAVAVQLALDKPLKALILECTFSCARDLGERWYPGIPLGWLLHYKFDSISKIPSITVPKLMSHSADDQLIPYDLGVRLYQAATSPKAFVSLRGDHDESGWTDSPQYWNELEAFVSSVLGPPLEEDHRLSST